MRDRIAYSRAMRGLLLALIAFGLLVGASATQAHGGGKGGGHGGGHGGGGHGKQKQIAWSSDKVMATVSPGESFSTTVSFTSSTDLENVTLGLTPSLADAVKVDPMNTASVSAGSPVSLTLTFTAPSSGDRKSFNGSLMVRSGNRTYARPLKLRFRVKRLEPTTTPEATEVSPTETSEPTEEATVTETSEPTATETMEPTEEATSTP